MKFLELIDDLGFKLDSYLNRKQAKGNAGGTVIKQDKKWMRSITWTLVGGSLLGMTWLATAQTEEIVTVTGKLEPVGQVKNVQIPVGGVATEILVESGQKVKKGQVLIKLDAETSEAQLKSAKTNLKDKEIQLEDKKHQLELKLDELAEVEALTKAQLASTQTNLNLHNDLLGRYQSLHSQGAISQVQTLDQQNKVQQLKSELSTIRISGRKDAILIKQEMEQLHGEIAGLDGEVAELQAKVTEADVNFGYKSLRAPVDGIVFDLKPTTVGFVGQSSEPVMKIVPAGSLLASVEIPSDQIGFVHKGQETSVSVDSFPASDFGVLAGKVNYIGSDALPPDQSKGRKQYQYPASIKIKDQSLQLKNGRKLPLQVGMSVTANIKLRHVSYLQLLLGSFRDKTDSIKRL